MAQNAGQQRAADRVAEELAHRGWTNTDLSRATVPPDSDDTPLDLGTIGDFLAYRRWPKITTLGRIERAFGWPAGSLRALSIHGTPIPEPRNETVSATDETGLDGWLTRVREDLTTEQQEQMWARYKHLFETMADEAVASDDPDTRRGTT